MNFICVVMMAAAPVGAVLMGFWAFRCLRHPHGRERFRHDRTVGTDRARRA